MRRYEIEENEINWSLDQKENRMYYDVCLNEKDHFSNFRSDLERQFKERIDKEEPETTINVCS